MTDVIKVNEVQVMAYATQSRQEGALTTIICNVSKCTECSVLNILKSCSKMVYTFYTQMYVYKWMTMEMLVKPGAQVLKQNQKVDKYQRCLFL